MVKEAKVPNNKLWKFIAKRALVLFILLSVLNIVFMEERWLILAGLALGCSFSILKLGSLINTISGIMLKSEKSDKHTGVIVKFLINQAVTIVLLAASISVSLWLFAGMTAGILLVPAAVFVNNITEILGITHNNFE